MRIVHYNHCNLESAEASTAHVMEFAEGLSQRNHDVTVVAPAKGKYRFLTTCCMHYFPYLNIKGFRQITAVISGFLTLIRLNITKKIDCIYIRRLALDPLPGIFSRLTNVPLIVETNGQIEIHEYEVPFHFLWRYFWYPLLKLIEWILFSAAFAVTADGTVRLNKFKKRYWRWPEKFIMIRSGGIDLNKFRRVDKSKARTELGLPQDKRLLVWVGTIFAWSGLKILIEAAEKICAELPDVNFIIIGDGPEQGYFIKIVSEIGLSHRIIFTGYIATNELFKWLSAGNLALAPYTRLRLDHEDFTSYKIFEYIACGLPVVCSYEKGGSNLGYVNEYNLGISVPPEDSDAFAKAIIQILSNESYFTEDFVRRARLTLRELDVTWDALVDKVEALCKSAVSKS